MSYQPKIQYKNISSNKQVNLTPEQKQKMDIDNAYKSGSVFFADEEYLGSQTVSVSNAAKSIFANADTNNDNQISKTEAALCYENFIPTNGKLSENDNKILNFLGINKDNAYDLAFTPTVAESTSKFANEKLADVENSSAQNKSINTDNDSNISFDEAASFIDKYNKMSSTDKEKNKAEYQKLREETGIVDGDFSDAKQYDESNCWLVSSVYSLSLSEKGRKILSQNVKQDLKNQTVTVQLPGIKDKSGKPFTRTYSNAQIKSAMQKYQFEASDNTNNPGMTAIEMAYGEYEKILDGQADASKDIHLMLNYRKHRLPSFGSQDLGSRSLSSGIKLLTGCSDSDFVMLNPNIDDPKDKDKFLSNFSNGNHPANSVSFKNIELDENVQSISDKKYNKDDDESFKSNGVSIKYGHAYTLVSANGDAIQLRDPHGETSEGADDNGIINITKEEFEKYVLNGSLKNL